jgi:branched-chain amino acid transport system permease protein
VTVLSQQVVNGLALGAGYALFAVGFTLIFGVNRILNLAQGAVFTWGALAGYWAAQHAGGLMVALLVGAVAGGVSSVVLDLVAFRPLRRRGASEFSALVTSLGALIIYQNLALRVTDAEFLAFPSGHLPGYVIHVAGLRVTPAQYTIVAVTVVLASALYLYLDHTRFGTKMHSVAADQNTASLLGINPNWIYLQAFFISGALAGVSGVLIAAAYRTVSFGMGEPYLLVGLAVIILGGMGNIPGAILGGLTFGVVHALTVQYLSSSLAGVLPFVMIVAVLLVRPTGLFGAVVAERRIGRA